MLYAQSEFKDPADSPTASYSHHPIEDIEPANSNPDAYREAAKKYAFILNRAFDWIIQARSPAVATWQIAFAIGLPCCSGQTMTSVAKTLGVERASISKGARQFCTINELQPSFYMKKEEASDEYRRTRIEVVKKS